jgi:predicted MFS family arabinose efflux permease
MGLGAILGPMISNRLMGSSIPALRKAIHYGYILVPIGWSLIAWSPTIWIVAAGALIRLMGTSINWTYSTALIQMEVPDRYRGRIFSFDLAMFTIATSSAVFLAGYFLDTLGITARTLGGYLAAGSVLPIFLWGLYRWWIRRPAAQAG